MKHIKKHKNQLLLISVGFAFALLIASILASNGTRPGMTVLMFVCLGYLIFMLINNRHIILQYCDDETREECEILRIWK